ncbi:MAG: HAMP domain-containing histidine kinase [Bacteroidia bacterium]
MNPITFADRLDKRLFKAISLGGVVVCLLLSVITLPLKHYSYSIFNLITAAICAISFFAYVKRWYNISMWVFFIGVPVLMVLYVMFFGNISSHFYIIPGAIALSFLTKRKKYWNELIWIFVAILFLFAEFLLFSKGKFSEFTSLENMLHFTNQFAALFLIYVVSYYFRNTHEEYRQHLESNNAIKEKLISVVSHDLRSPMNSIKGVIDLFDNDDITKEEFKELLRTLSTEVDKTSYMLDNTLLWIKNQLSSAEPNIEPLKFVDFAEATIEQYSHQIEEKGIDVVYMCGIEKSLRLETDAEMLRLIIRNIISNAIKFTPKQNGKIVLKCGNEGKNIIFSINDNGHGMTQEQQKSLFSMQNGLTNGTKGELGFGLGLNLAKSYADKINVKIDVESAIDKGTTFTLNIPSLSVE